MLISIPRWKYERNGNLKNQRVLVFRFLGCGCFALVPRYLALEQARFWWIFAIGPCLVTCYGSLVVSLLKIL